MTFSIVARDETGALGSAICSSSPAVAARCTHLADGVGAVNSQNVTDPRLGPILLEALRTGASAQEALDTVTAQTEHIEYRQLLVVDAAGGSAVYSGGRALGIFGDSQGQGVAAGGNMLAAATIPDLMVAAFGSAAGELEERLLAALRAAIAAGGEAGPVHSAGLSVVRAAGWRVTDLRVDWTDADPVAELGDLLEVWLPQRDDYVSRGIDPTVAPSYGVPGDE
ncbi:DUF1028 domain-containing protein [Pseudoclavibacter sp. Z016]|uniref:DUF1028 domain-containing protein n=1 Tax=Pseudoclavibacter sp. Z016 TaxID=2080581 RepID=UPI000CE81978|nr:DUF1028 domain-containing protein [Pseudoclavibacter sp. Z016]PPF76268.1 DUF1028 domain-containing protein [Pseudoclavibacter sp. Z016]